MFGVVFNGRLITCQRFIKPLKANFIKVATKATASTLSSDEVATFDRLSKNWWDDVSGPVKLLHSMNELRVPLIRDGLTKHPTAPVHKPLTGLKILDIGCGAGILSEPLARLGAEVLGIDASDENIQLADYRANLDERLKKNLRYKKCLVEELGIGKEDREMAEDFEFDGVLMSEIVEHVKNVEMFVRSSCSFVKPGGSMFITTINRTKLSYLSAIVAAEKMLKIVPSGVHDWDKFVTPDELMDILKRNNFQIRLLHGMCLNPATERWSWCNNTLTNYAMHAVKMAENGGIRLEGSNDEKNSGISGA
ncbi:hypothetical protein HELRODRAFT_186006 [Helobdella robusta]|uniref:Ubiquinone biosynthesis O-methyltransferase, mitochondrial n=1 Tax=Helobdella robusta TaxID=6412 RepID=T1FNJ5_HELRO|nr:hypothetical protein HELRODRAFT_186006 [Helobdella robusta]ESN95158.1 hypothetical protein HELRODRAFT_186006 [Helobdella robusta]